MKDREFRGGSEPPPPPADVNDKTGLRRVPVKIAGVAVGSTEQLNGEGAADPPAPPQPRKVWRRSSSVTPNRDNIQ